MTWKLGVLPPGRSDEVVMRQPLKDYCIGMVALDLLFSKVLLSSFHAHWQVIVLSSRH